MKVTVTASPTSTASAMPGPNARRKPRSATASAMAPAATAIPQARISGVSSCAVSTTARCGSSPSRNRRLKRDM